jgi:hypothetical protein
VTLLLIEALVGEKHDGFSALLGKARTALNQPWLGAGLTQADVRSVDPTRHADLDATYLLAQQIGPILAEGTKGNPRQIKRFLNALLVRRAIARARGFGESISQPAQAKLMLAERFQPDFYEHIAAGAMVSEDGKVADLGALETAVQEDTKGARAARKGGKAPDKANAATATDSSLDKWLGRDWLQRWLRIEPSLASIDLRPYVFVARDKRMLSAAAELGGLEGLIDKLCGPEMAIRSVEPEVRALPPADAEQVFTALRERVISHGSFSAPPPGFEGLAIVAKHHPRFQMELLDLVSSIDVNALGIWVVKGWNETLTEAAARDQLQAMMNRWATQDGNALLKRATAAALGSMRRGGGG